MVALDPANKPPLVAVVFLFASSRLLAEKKDLKKILWITKKSPLIRRVKFPGTAADSLMQVNLAYRN